LVTSIYLTIDTVIALY